MRTTELLAVHGLTAPASADRPPVKFSTCAGDRGRSGAGRDDRQIADGVEVLNVAADVDRRLTIGFVGEAAGNALVIVCSVLMTSLMRQVVGDQASPDRPSTS